MMKMNRHLLLKGLILMIMAAFTFSSATAQEEKEEKKIMKIKMTADDDGNVTIDTTIVLDEDFEGDWKALIDDEELLEQIENIEIDLNLDDDGNIYLIKSPHTTKKAYYYSVESDDDGEVTVKVEHEMEDIHDIHVKTIEGDTTLTFVIKTDCKESDGEKQVMIWHTDGDDKHKDHNVTVSKSMDVHVDVVDGDSVITYTIEMKDEDGEHKDVMIWHSDGDEEITHDVILEKIEGDSCKVIIVTAGDDGKTVIMKKKEVIIITDEDHDNDHDHDKDKKKKKKKKDDD